LQGLLGGGEPVGAAHEPALWKAAREFAWVREGQALVKIPLTPGRIVALESALESALDDFRSLRDSGGFTRYYGAGGQVAWVALLPAGIAALDVALAGLGLAGLVVLAPELPANGPRIGQRAGVPFERRVKDTLDPAGKFVEA
jgi:hypothetical protein